jgi:membrane protein
MRAQKSRNPTPPDPARQRPGAPAATPPDSPSVKTPRTEVPLPNRTPAWRRNIERITSRITSNRLVAQLLATMAAANEAAAPLFAAAMAFSTMFAIIPLALLLAGVLGWLIDDPTQRSALLAQLVSYLPPLADVLEQSLEGAVRQRGALSIVGIVGLLWGSSAFYGGLDEVMRRIFPGGSIRGELSRRARGVAAILILILLIVGTVSLSSLWALLDEVAGSLGLLSVLPPVIAIGVMILVALAVYLFVPTAPPSWRAALLPAIFAGAAIGVLTNLFSVLTPLLIGGMSGFGVIATVFGALVWLNLSYQVLLYGAAWARVRRDREESRSGVVGA